MNETPEELLAQLERNEPVLNYLETSRRLRGALKEAVEFIRDVENEIDRPHYWSRVALDRISAYLRGKHPSGVPDS